jgi:hypothetical protein
MAFNAVSARKTLSRPTQVSTDSARPSFLFVAPSHVHAQEMAPVAPTPQKPKKQEWSQAVRDYVGRAFETTRQIKGIERPEVQEKLKSIISYFAERGQLDNMDWATYPLPQEILRDERDAAAGAGHNAMEPLTSFSNVSISTPLKGHSKKRKSQDAEEVPVRTDAPAWHGTTNLESRMTYAAPIEKRHKKNAISREGFSKADKAALEQRKNRFGLDAKPKQANPWSSPRIGQPDDDTDMSTATCVGTNTKLEKSYFRLTAPPNPEDVRPQYILEKTLSMLTKKWKEEKKYGYICNQFKSLRQDLTVQHIKNAFTVKVYEIHARIALETGDTGEYNQCQTQLKALYSQNLGGNPAEFTAYRILYFVYTCNKTDMNDLLATLTPTDKTQPWIKHALDVRSSLALGNYHKFFRLYVDAPNMGSYLMDMFIERERLHALANISRA